MYIPAHFEEFRPEVLHALIEARAFGALITHGADGLDANHLPFLLERGAGSLGVLHCHVARDNPLWRQLANGDEVLVVFNAADGYVSPQWYPSKHETHRQVPTWNYLVAHAHGRVTVRDDPAYVGGVVARLTQRHEATQPTHWKMADATRDYIETLLKSIVGLEIEITRLLGKAKLSQNKAPRDIRGAAQSLCDQGDTILGQAMFAAADAQI